MIRSAASLSPFLKGFQGVSRPLKSSSSVWCSRLFSKGRSNDDSFTTYQSSPSSSSSTTATDAAAAAAVTPLSRRKQFRQIPVNPKILQYIREEQICKPIRQSRSRKLDRFVEKSGGTSPWLPRNKKHSINRPTTTTTTTTRNNTNRDTPVIPRRRPPPLPFGRGADPVRVRYQIRPTDEDIPAVIEKLNPKKIPTVALCGRSNVGKSTLLNALLYGNRPMPLKDKDESSSRGPVGGGRRGAFQPIPLPKGSKATMSPKPGETKEISFYELSAKRGEHKLWLADLPGYGFAYASEEIAAGFRDLMATYLCHKTKKPQRLLLLLDARHGMKQTDRIFLNDLQDHGYREQQHQLQLPAMQIVLTKCDLVEATDLARRVALVQDELDDVMRRQTSRLPVLLTSATRQNGILAVQRELAGLT